MITARSAIRFAEKPNTKLFAAPVGIVSIYPTVRNPDKLARANKIMMIISGLVLVWRLVPRDGKIRFILLRSGDYFKDEKLSDDCTGLQLVRRYTDQGILRKSPFRSVTWSPTIYNQTMRTQVITLTTDFGIQDEFVGVMKGVIWKIHPAIQIADITHTIQPQNILHGAIILGRAYRYFPAGTIHIAVVDPGVGTHRRGLIARVGDHFFVGPDNGLFTAPFSSGVPVEVYALENTRLQLQSISSTFHGRDIFAPAAAFFANGTPLSEFGPVIRDPIRIEIPRPLRIGNIVEGQILYADTFGNLVTNVTRDDLADETVQEIRCGGQRINGISTTFGSAQPDELVAIFDSGDALSLCVVNGNARQSLGSVQKVELIIK